MESSFPIKHNAFTLKGIVGFGCIMVNGHLEFNKHSTKMNSIDGIINWSDKTFLIVEDEEVSTQYLQELLGPTKVNLLYAITADEAISLCQSHPDLDLVLMDIKLPGTDGYKATKQIKQMRSDLPIIAQTAYAMIEDRIKAIDAGCNDYIAKPIRANELFAMIQRCLIEK